MADIVDDLKRIPMSPGLAGTLGRAADYAQAQHHSAVELEHLLLALTEDDDAGQVLAASHVNMALLKADVSQYLGGMQGQHGSEASGQFGLAPDLKRILEAAAAAASQGKRREINGAIVLAAIVGDGRSPAAHMLRAQGLTFEEAIKALQRALAANPASPAAMAAAAPAAPAIDTEDVLATARARVQTRAAPGLTTTRPEPPREPKAEAWPPDVRPSAEKMRTAVNAEIGAVAAAPNFEGTDYELDYEAGPPPEETGWADEPAAAPHQPPYAPAPQYARPALPAGGGHPFRAAPQPGSRWPAPVEPAWRDSEPVPVPVPQQWQPPPLPPSYPASTPVPPPLPADPYGYDAQTSAPPPSSASWPQSDPYGRSAGGMDHGTDWPAPPVHDPHNGPPGGPAPHPSTDASMGSPEAASAASVDAAKPSRKRKSERVAAGQMVETIPRKMRAHVPAAVEVRLAKTDFQTLADGLQAEDVRRHAVLVTPAMSVRLRAPDGGFIIDAASPETQWLSNKLALIEADFASWRWTVTPLKSGRRRLQLVVSARTSVPDGTAADTALPDQIIDVRVATNYGRTSLRLAGWGIAAVAGGMFAKFGGALYDPAIAAVLAALK